MELNEKLQEALKEIDLEKAVKDPSYFSKVILDIEARWYQSIMLKKGGNRKVFRCGRRIGKTFALIIKILHSIYMNENFDVLIIAPLGIQVDTIFKELRNIINNNDILQNSIVRSVQSPQTIELKNGSSVLGLSAGTTSGSGAKNTRGQGADLIVLDEADYLSESDLNSIMGTQLEDMDKTEIWAASTPTGNRGMFYNFCKKAGESYGIKDIENQKPVKLKREVSNGWTEFHFPSHVHPNWNSDMESELRAMFSETGFVHEVLAEFGDSESGVYKNDYIEKSAYDYKYDKYRNAKQLPSRVRIIGVDWDKINPTQIIVSEFDHTTNKIKIIDRISIDPQEYIFDAAVNKVVELNGKYNPDFIYLDRGYGEYQVETLKKKLGKKVKGVQFSEKIEIKDPIDGTVDKKETKHFMVNQTTILLEREQLMFSKHDEHFLDQLRNYRIVKFTSSGKPIYNDDNEHAHDAFALTILGFNQEYPDLAQLLEKHRVAKSMGFVNKKLVPKDSNFGGHAGSEYGFSNQEEDLMEDEPHYVKHMKSIEFQRKRGSSIGRKSWSSRGNASGRSPGRKSF